MEDWQEVLTIFLILIWGNTLGLLYIHLLTRERIRRSVLPVEASPTPVWYRTTRSHYLFLFLTNAVQIPCLCVSFHGIQANFRLLCRQNFDRIGAEGPYTCKDLQNDNLFMIKACFILIGITLLAIRLETIRRSWHALRYQRPTAASTNHPLTFEYELTAPVMAHIFFTASWGFVAVLSYPAVFYYGEFAKKRFYDWNTVWAFVAVICFMIGTFYWLCTANSMIIQAKESTRRREVMNTVHREWVREVYTHLIDIQTLMLERNNPVAAHV